MLKQIGQKVGSQRGKNLPKTETTDCENLLFSHGFLREHFLKIVQSTLDNLLQPGIFSKYRIPVSNEKFERSQHALKFSLLRIYFPDKIYLLSFSLSYLLQIEKIFIQELWKNFFDKHPKTLWLRVHPIPHKSKLCLQLRVKIKWVVGVSTWAQQFCVFEKFSPERGTSSKLWPTIKAKAVKVGVDD